MSGLEDWLIYEIDLWLIWVDWRIDWSVKLIFDLYEWIGGLIDLWNWSLIDHEWIGGLIDLWNWSLIDMSGLEDWLICEIDLWLIWVDSRIDWSMKLIFDRSWVDWRIDWSVKLIFDWYEWIRGLIDLWNWSLIDHEWIGGLIDLWNWSLIDMSGFEDWLIYEIDLW